MARTLLRIALRLLKWLGVTLFVLVAIGVVYLLRERHLAHEELKAAVAELDQAEPDWTLDRILAKRPDIADADNGALVVKAAFGRLPKKWDPKFIDDLEATPPNRRLRPDVLTELRDELRATEPALAAARKILSHASGRYPIVYEQNFFSTLLPDLQKPRPVAQLLLLDASLAAEEQRPDRALESIRAALNVGRSMDDEPLLISILTRVAIQNMAIRSLERTLGQEAASEEALAPLQKILADEAATELFVLGMLGERAGVHQTMDFFAASDQPVSFVIENMGPDGTKGKQPTWWDHVFDLPARKMVDRSHVQLLRDETRILESAALPGFARYEKLQQFDDEFRTRKIRDWRNFDTILANMLLPAILKVSEAEQRTDTLLHSAVAGLAAERFRLKEGRWPADLAELVRVGLLPAVPEDLFDGQPIRFRRTADGLVIHSVGKDKHYGGDDLDAGEPLDPNKQRIEFRLWDVGSRRRPPLPAPPKPIDDDQ